MSRTRVLAVLVPGMLLGMGFFIGAPAQQTGPGNKAAGKSKKAPENEIIQEFPTNDAAQTAWKVHYATMDGFGLIIQDAWFKKDPKEPWIQVLGDSRLAEMFVPYHSGSPRFWDISYNFSLIQVSKNEAGPFGKVLGNPPKVVYEVRDRGLMWIDSVKGSRRGQKMVLWACLNAANYRYVIEYGFQDDGLISFRVGSTGRNYASREWEGHMHNGLWRVDINLDGPENNSVYVMEHGEPDGAAKAKARTTYRPFNQGKEGFEDWNANRFTTLTVINEKKQNLRGKAWGYDLCSQRHGNARHYGPENEECTQHDFWVTKNRPGEIYYQKLPQYVKNAAPIANTDVVLWHSTPGHHEPRSEDGEMKDNSFHGVTPIAWCGFELRPRNFWDRSPFYP